MITLDDDLKTEINKVFKYDIGTILYCKDYNSSNYKTYKVIIVNRSIIQHLNGYSILYGCNTINTDIYIEFNEENLYVKN